jgi:transposase
MDSSLLKRHQSARLEVSPTSQRKKESTMKIIRIGLDLAKNVFQVHGVDLHGKTGLRRQLRRNQMLEFFKKQSPCLIGMEACASAHYWARTLIAMGHEVKLIAPQFVKPYVKGNKNDANDAEAICEAVGRPNMRFVPVKTVEQQDIQALHRIRQELVHQRTAKVNQIRGLLGEYGIVVEQRVPALRKKLPKILEDAENGLTIDFRVLLDGLRDDLVNLDTRIGSMDQAIQKLAQEHAGAKRLQQLRGIGPITATALIAAIGNGSMFERGRDAAAWCGLVPGQHSSGGKDRLLGISKRGDAYLRTLLIHGARAVIKTAQGKDDRLSRWLQSLCSRRNKNIAAVALANKTMRMAWALLTSEQDYDPEFGAGTESACAEPA